MDVNYQLDLTKSYFYKLIGFDKEVVEATKIGLRVPNLSQDTEIINIHCDLIDESLVDGDENLLLVIGLVKQWVMVQKLGKGLLLGKKNSPFNSIQILGTIL